MKKKKDPRIWCVIAEPETSSISDLLIPVGRCADVEQMFWLGGYFYDLFVVPSLLEGINCYEVSTTINSNHPLNSREVSGGTLSFYPSNADQRGPETGYMEMNND